MEPPSETPNDEDPPSPSDAEGPSSQAEDPQAGGEAPAGAEWAEVPGLVARGLCMGMADVVPGVSGGTMALILGIYTRLIRAIRSLDLGALKLLFRARFRELLASVHWRFLGAVVCGQALGVVICTKGIKLPTLIKTHPEPVYGLFFGLVLGSTVWLLRSLAKDRGEAGPGQLLSALALGGLAGLAVVTASPAAGTPSTPLFLFFCGAVSICAMVLPGISGSFVLLLLQQYETVLGAVGEVIHPTGEAGRLGPLLNVVLPFAAGCLVGLMTFVRLLSALLRRAEKQTMAFMAGLLAGSLHALWPFAERTYVTVRGKEKLIGRTLELPDLSAGSTWLAVGLLVGGCVAVIALERLTPGDGSDA